LIAAAAVETNLFHAAMIQDDDTIKSTGNEAERLLDELQRPAQTPNQPPRPTPTDPNRGQTQEQTPDKEKKTPKAATPWILAGLLAVALLFVMYTKLDLKRAGPSPVQKTTADTPPTDKTTSDLTTQQPSQIPAQEPPPRPVIVKTQRPDFEPPVDPPKGQWGPANSYKFGRVPDNTFPNSCAFSQTDSAGQMIISRTQMDYWACRDEGGNTTDGFSVTWVDGKRTKYTFGPDGIGSIVGTNGSVYPIKWRNDIKNGDKVIITSHEDGATSWIPGHVN
jgi:hypothetical protein